MTTWHRDGALHFALGIEDTFVPQGGPGERPIDEYELTDHYGQFREDFAAAREAGAELLRWGVPWHRVNPEPGCWDWDWTDRAVDAMLEAGLEPIVDLLHYGTPLWVEQQFHHPDYPRLVEEYARQVALRYGDRVKSYTPVNEPMIHVLFCGEYGYWPPYGRGVSGMARTAAAVAEGFVRSQHAIADAVSDAVLVHVDAGMRYDGDLVGTPYEETGARLEAQRFLVEDLVTGRVDDHHPLTGLLLSHGWDEDRLRWFQQAPVAPDVMGVNYYPRHSTEVLDPTDWHDGGFGDPRASTDAGVAGLEDVLTLWYERYGAPVMLTETCVTAPVEERIAWMRDSVATVDRLRRRGVDVVGYTWWPLFDMYEWTYRHGEGPRSDYLLTMGLQDLVEDEGRLARVSNPAHAVYRELARSHRAGSR